MTTIAIKNGILATDSLSTYNCDQAILVDKIIKLKSGAVAAGCGDRRIIHKFVEWFENGKNKEDKFTVSPDEYFEVLIAYPDGKIETWNHQFFPLEARDPWAIGTGSKYAIGAMEYGASAVEAVEIAIRYDIGSGGAVQKCGI